MEHDDRFFELVDTGGMGIDDVDNLTKHIEEQIEAAIDSADVILFVVDTRAGMMPLDQEVGQPAAVRRRAGDLRRQQDRRRAARRRRPTSSTARPRQAGARSARMQNRNRAELLDMILERLPPRRDDRDAAAPSRR